ncbi:MAG: bifunctional response regulator/alkaline phosphatase family protein [Bacteroidales bacterium]|jgi:CheY-like chemotaxis protein|nr:bifunctional response regulator/alkaline phosphatase family protein [Bacteroidales bacterium]
MSRQSEPTARQIRILWIDDEIEVLKPHILYLSDRGYEIDTCTNGNDAIDMVKTRNYDLIFLDEHMPGLSGIETLSLIRQSRPDIPVIMITRSEEEKIMDAAIGSEIADYLIKPVKPAQIILAIRKNTEQKRLVTEKTATGYLAAFGSIGSLIATAAGIEEWYEVYRRLVFWQTELRKSSDPGLRQVLDAQIADANKGYSRFVISNYLKWTGSNPSEKPLMSPSVLEKRVFPLIDGRNPLFLIVIDNLRYDQWKSISPIVSEYYRIASEDFYTSILPTATQYSRNALFSGLMPLSIRDMMPTLWKDDDDEEGKNNFEDKLLERLLARSGLSLKWSYAKLINNQEARKFNEKYRSFLQHDLVALVYNSVDMLSHSRTDVEVMKELAADDEAYCSVTTSWFIHSPLSDLLRQLSDEGVRVVITTDHGNVRVKNPLKIVGDRSTSANLRYKLGRNLAYNPKEVFEIPNPRSAGLPSPNISSKFIFATGHDYLVYQNNFNHFAAHYRDTIQHGGISLHEMVCPIITLEPPQ